MRDSTDKKKIVITTECTCDLSIEQLRRYDIRQVGLYIQTDRGSFLDTVELDAGNISKYLSADCTTMHAVNASVEDYRKLFREALEDADSVIHVTFAKGVGKSYAAAMEAAGDFPGVSIFDSGQLSGGQALFVLRAAQFAEEGCEVTEVLERLERDREHIYSRFLFPSVKIFYTNGYTSRLIWKLCDLFSLRPLLHFSKSRFLISGVCMGDMPACRKWFIRRCLRGKRHIDTSLVYVAYVGCDIRERKEMAEEIAKYIHFEQVIFQKCSVTNACNSGLGSISISYFLK